MAGPGKRSKTPRDTEAMRSAAAPREAEPDAAPHSAAPDIRALTGAECEALLDRNRVGRIAYAAGRHVDIVPIHYIRDGAWLYGRTSPGDKVSAWLHNRWIAFEVDEVRDLFHWASVIVHGGLYVIPSEGPDRDDELYQHAVGLLRRLIPGTGTAGDPVPSRSVLFRIHLDEVQGRAAGPFS
jgi:hypothetical protein